MTYLDRIQPARVNAAERLWCRAQQLAAAAAMLAVALTAGITLARLVVYLWNAG